MVVLTKRFSIAAILEITISSDRGDFWLFFYEDCQKLQARFSCLKVELTQDIIP